MASGKWDRKQFQGMEGSLTAIGGADGSSLIEGRNQVAIEALHRTLDSGKKKIAIFYGGGHMPDMDKHLRADFGLVPAETREGIATVTIDRKDFETLLE